MQVASILRVKGPQVYTIRPEARLDEVVQKLVEFNVGSLVVVEHSFTHRGRRMIGIVTERDILRACAARKSPLETMHVSDVMTRDVISGSLADDVEHVMGVMTEHRIRHLPLVEEGMLVGIISIGDVVKAQHDKLTMENHFLKSYLHGENSVS